MEFIAGSISIMVWGNLAANSGINKEKTLQHFMLARGMNYQKNFAYIGCKVL